MTHPRSDTLLQVLRDGGLPLSTEQVSAEDSAPTPWFVRVLHAISGWLASIFLLMMFGAIFHRLFDNVPTLLMIGVSLIGVAFAFFQRSDHTLFLEHLALSLSLAGQALIGFAIFQMFGHTFSSTLSWLIFAVVELILFFGIRDSFHRLISAFLFAAMLDQSAYLVGISFVTTPLLFGVMVWAWISNIMPLRPFFSNKPQDTVLTWHYCGSY